MRPSYLYIIATTSDRLGACEAVRDVVRARNSKNVRRRSTYGWTHSPVAVPRAGVGTGVPGSSGILKTYQLFIMAV